MRAMSVFSDVPGPKMTGRRNEYEKSNANIFMNYTERGHVLFFSGLDTVNAIVPAVTHPA